MACKELESIKAKIAENELNLTKQFNRGTLTTGSKATLQTERDTLCLQKRDHKFLGHGGKGCPDA